MIHLVVNWFSLNRLSVTQSREVTIRRNRTGGKADNSILRVQRDEQRRATSQGEDGPSGIFGLTAATMVHHGRSKAELRAWEPSNGI